MLHISRVQKIFGVVALISAGAFLLDVFQVRTNLARELFSHTNPQEALILRPNDPELLEAIGHYYLNSGGYDIGRAEEAYTRASKLSSTTIWAEYQLGRIAFVRGDFETAHRYFETALEKNPHNKRIIYARGVMYGFENKLPEAESDFLEFIAWAPTEWGAYNDLAWVYAKQGKFEDSLRIAERGIASTTQGQTNPWLWNAKGVAQFNLNDFSGAVESFSIAQAQAHNLTKAEWIRAYSANDPTQAENALEQFKESIQANIEKSRKGVEWVDKSNI